MSTTALLELAKVNSLQRAWNGLNKSNKSSRGSDGIKIQDFSRNLTSNLETLCSELRNNRYSFRPLRPVKIAKDRLNPSRGTRTLQIPTIRDRVVLKALQEFITPELVGFNAPFSFAYQDKKNVETAISEILQLSQIYSFAVEADIKSYFDLIPVELLIESLFRILPQSSLKPLIKLALQVEEKIVDPTETASADYFGYDQRGIAQGSALSPTLANFYLAPLDYVLARLKIPTIRYADDIVLFAQSSNDAIKAYEIAKETLKLLGLDMHPLGTSKDSKSHIRNLKTDGLECLGYRIEQGNLLPGGKFVQKLNDEIKEITNPKSVGIGFKGAPISWEEDTILSRANYLRKKVDGKAGAIRITDECSQIRVVDDILVNGFFNLFTACGITLKNLNDTAHSKLGIPRFEKIWQEKRCPIPTPQLLNEKIELWVKNMGPNIENSFPRIRKYSGTLSIAA